MIGSGWYDSTLDDYIAAGDLVGMQKHIDWLEKNAIPVKGVTNFNCLYISASLLRKKLFTMAVEYAFSKKIKLGIAFSSLSEVKAMMEYNVGKKDSQRLVFAISEVEPWNHDISNDEYLSLLKDAKSLLGNLHLSTYIGRPDISVYPRMIKTVDSIHLHCYLKTYGPVEIWHYCEPRLKVIASTCKQLQRQIQVIPIFSNEPKNPQSGEEFGYEYFKTKYWNVPVDNFNAAFIKNANPDMKKYIQIGDGYFFKVKYAKQLRP